MIPTLQGNVVLFFNHRGVEVERFWNMEEFISWIWNIKGFWVNKQKSKCIANLQVSGSWSNLTCKFVNALQGIEVIDGKLWLVEVRVASLTISVNYELLQLELSRFYCTFQASAYVTFLFAHSVNLSPFLLLSLFCNFRLNVKFVRLNA